MKTRAMRDGDGAYMLNGEKCFITFSPVADYILVFARIGDVSAGPATFQQLQIGY
jgi:alkylation response protein AidB-like acyl-CoA dehydrogenase